MASCKIIRVISSITFLGHLIWSCFLGVSAEIGDRIWRPHGGRPCGHSMSCCISSMLHQVFHTVPNIQVLDEYIQRQNTPKVKEKKTKSGYANFNRCVTKFEALIFHRFILFFYLQMFWKVETGLASQTSDLCGCSGPCVIWKARNGFNALLLQTWNS